MLHRWSWASGRVRIVPLAVSILSLAALCGCATKFSEGTQSVTTLQLVKGGTSGRYMLVDGSHRLISTADATRAGLTFDLPGRYRIDDCVAVIDAKRETATARPYLNLSLRSQYQKLIEEKRIAAEREAAADNRKAELQEQLRLVEARLASNRAYSGQQCVLPAMRAVPPTPQIMCGTEQECRQEGVKLCGKVYVKAQLCGYAVSKALPNVLSNPACGALTADSELQEYGFNEAAADAFKGWIEDRADELRKSSDRTDQILGTFARFLLGVNEVSNTMECVDAFVKSKYEEPMLSWQSEVDQVRAEPTELLNSCRADDTRTAPLAGALQEAEAIRANSAARINVLEEQMRQLMTARAPVEWCVAR
jgi:multidrug efflux pump subunit AcrA (membrane-fusion protein)